MDPQHPPLPITLDVAVVMRKERITGAMSRWQDWRWVLEDVVDDEPGFGDTPKLLYHDENQQRWLHPGFTVRLFKDDAEGYLLNASAPAPCWFVLWRMEEEPSSAEEPLARPEIVTLSYHDAGRWLDAQETVEQIPAPAHIVTWLKAFIATHYVAEPKRRRRPVSFQPLQDRFGNPASVTTIKTFGGQPGEVPGGAPRGPRPGGGAHAEAGPRGGDGTGKGARTDTAPDGGSVGKERNGGKP